MLSGVSIFYAESIHPFQEYEIVAIEVASLFSSLVNSLISYICTYDGGWFVAGDDDQDGD